MLDECSNGLESCYVQESTEWKMNTTIFNKICKKFSQSSIDLFASHLTKQIVLCLKETRPILRGSRCSLTKMDPCVPICVSTVLPGGESNTEGDPGQNHDNNNYNNMAIPTMKPNASQKTSIRNPLRLPNWQNLRNIAQGGLNPKIKTKKLRLPAWLMIRIGRFPVQTPLGTQPGLGTQPHSWLLVTFRSK